MGKSLGDTEKTQTAQRLCDAGRFADALLLFRELERDSDNTLEAAGYLVDAATCYLRIGNPEAARECVSKARELAANDALAQAQIDFFEATELIEAGEQEQGVEALSRILDYASAWLNSNESRELYERVQIQRAFTLMHLSKGAEARPILEEAASFDLENDVKSSVHCHLGRLNHESKEYALAKQNFVVAEKLGVRDNWAAAFHYYFGFALYELKEFDAARRQLILSVQSGPSGPPASYRYKMLAAVSRKLGEWDRAREYDKLARSL